MQHNGADMPTSRMIRTSRRGFSIIEVAIASFIITVVSLAGFAYYATARVGEINEWHEQNALFLSEREVESWQNNGYTGLAGFNSGQVAPNFLPYGYRFGAPDAAWDQTNRRKVVVLDGFTYHVRARNLWSHNATNDYYVEETWSGISYRYRRVEIHIQWAFTGGSPQEELILETRMAR